MSYCSNDGQRAYRLFEARPCPQQAEMRTPHQCRRLGPNGRPCPHLQRVAGFLHTCTLERAETART